jgi:ribonucleoside-diphosphate reductase alpha chain
MKRIRPYKLKGYSYHAETPCGPLYVTCNDDENGNLFEVFCVLGKAGGCGTANKNAIGRAVSIGLRSGASPEDYIKTFLGTNCSNSSADKFSCIHQIGVAIKTHEEGKEEK